MEELIAVFEPIKNGNNNLAVICGLIAVLSLAFTFYNHRRPVPKNKQSMRQLLSLLAGFIFLISIGSGFFSFWAGQKMIPVKVYSDAIETAYGKSDLEDIGKLYIHYDQKLSLVSGKPQGDSTRLLLIVEHNGKTHVLSEENYDIDSLARVLRKLE